MALNPGPLYIINEAAKLGKLTVGLLSDKAIASYKRIPDLSFDERKEILNNYAGSIAICDDGGVTIIKKEYVNQDTLERLKRIELQEDIWSFCLDTLKWDTKKIICEKAYLEEQEFLVKSHIAQFDELNKGFDRSDE